MSGDWLPPDPPQREEPDPATKRGKLVGNVRDALAALPVHFSSQTSIEGLEAGDLFSLNSMLGGSMSDEDREFDSDLAYMRDLVTELHVHGSVEHLAGILDAPMAEWDIDLYLEPWPTGMDLAGDMLAAWRAGTTDLDIYAIGQSS